MVGTTTADDIRLIVDRVAKRGVDLHQYKDGFLKRRLDVRLKARDVHSYADYARLLDSDATEFQALLATFSINVTEFFRDFHFYEAFYSKIIPELYSQAQALGREVRVWSAGCASGEEPYTIALLFAEAAESLQGLRCKVIATDVSAKALDTARAGVYAQASLKNVPPEIMAKYFIRTADGKYQVSPRLKLMISFEQGNLSTMTPPKAIDAVFCRNVLMYFDKETQNKIQTKFHQSLRSRGFFILGQSEALMGEPTRMFETVMARERIYRKKESVTPSSLPSVATAAGSMRQQQEAA
jgi:chemotaxis protein methyltransferase CheR